MTDIADSLQKIDTTASQRGQHDELTSLILHGLKQLWRREDDHEGEPAR